MYIFIYIYLEMFPRQASTAFPRVEVVVGPQFSFSWNVSYGHFSPRCGEVRLRRVKRGHGDMKMCCLGFCGLERAARRGLQINTGDEMEEAGNCQDFRLLLFFFSFFFFKFPTNMELKLCSVAPCASADLLVFTLHSSGFFFLNQRHEPRCSRVYPTVLRCYLFFFLFFCVSDL